MLAAGSAGFSEELLTQRGATWIRNLSMRVGVARVALGAEGCGTLVTLGDQILTATDTVSGITGTATVPVGSGP
jgi:hypothetical protein